MDSKEYRLLKTGKSNLLFNSNSEEAVLGADTNGIQFPYKEALPGLGSDVMGCSL